MTLNLLEFLIKFDFFFVELKKKSVRENKTLTSLIKLTNKNQPKYYFVLDPLQFTKDLKRIIRIFQFINSKKKASSLLNFENEYSFENFKFLTLKAGIDTKKIKIFNKIRLNKKVPSKAFFFFDSSPKKNSYTNLLLVQKYLFTELNTLKTTQDLGVYKLFTNFNDRNKLIFLALLLKALQKNKICEK